MTHNQLAVTRLVPAGAESEFNDQKERKRLLELALCASQVRKTDAGYSGDPLDVAIIERLVTEAGRAEQIPPDGQRHFPFDVDKKRAAGLGTVEGQQVFAVKGAWEAIRPMLTGIESGDGTTLAVDQTALDRAERTMITLASTGFRVVAVAYRSIKSAANLQYSQDQLEKELVLAGFLGIEDPIREEVPAALASCHAAGVKVILITGDHPDTAMNVATRCGLIDQSVSAEVVMTGDVLEELSETELVEALTTGVRIFARTSPSQKMKIVMAIKGMDQVVAMTGDGVNDAPALKAADIGIAMGKVALTWPALQLRLSCSMIILPRSLPVSKRGEQSF